MKKIIITKSLILSFIYLVSCISVNAQCTNQLFHTSGTLSINGVQVTTTSFGDFGIVTNYCPNSTQPYLIGADYSYPNHTGGYTFQFSPSVDSVSLNFSGMHNGEMVQIYVNGNHYSVPSIGVYNGCDSLAHLTPTGDIVGQIDGSPSGWNGTIISGPINEITVIDSIIEGTPNGVVFSIFFCSNFTTSINENSKQKTSVYPIPTKDKIKVETEVNSELEISNLQGQVIISKILYQEISDVDISLLDNGVYILSISKNGKSETKKIVKN